MNDPGGRKGALNLALLFGAIYFVQGVGEPTEGLLTQPVRSLLEGWGEPTDQIAAFMALLGLPWALEPLYGLLSDFVPLRKQRRRSYLIATTGATAASMLLVYLFPPASGAATLLLAMLVSFAVGLAYMTATLTQLDLAAQWCPPHLAGTMFALFMALSNLSASLAIWVGGRIYEDASAAWGTDAAFRIVVGLGALTTAACWLLLPFLRKASSEVAGNPST